MRAFQATAEPLVSVDEAQKTVLAEVAEGPVERVGLDGAQGRVLREDVIAPHDVPRSDNSAMDGYAVRSADTPGRIRVIGDVAAGARDGARIEPGTAVRIMTGAAIPEGADAVAQVEITDGGMETVNVERAVAPGVNIRRRGDDMRSGSVILRSGVRIGAAEIAALATVGKREVAAGRAPVVAILATGNELVEPGEDGAVVNSNSHMLAALVRGAGGVARTFGIVRDDRDTTIRALESALGADVIVTSGGVSVGAYDFVKEALEVLGAEFKFWRVAMKPGKPLLFAKLRGRLFFGLPGNPASSMTSFHLFVGPAIRRWAGEAGNVFPPSVRMTSAAPMKGAAERRSYIRVRVIAREGRLHAEPMRAQGSHQISSMVSANGLAVIDAGTSGVQAGGEIEVLITGPIIHL